MSDQDQQAWVQVRAAVWSMLRVFGAALLASIPAAWAAAPNHDVTTWGWTGAAAFAGAVVLTAINALRSGDTRFGVGATTSSGKHEL